LYRSYSPGVGELSAGRFSAKKRRPGYRWFHKKSPAFLVKAGPKNQKTSRMQQMESLREKRGSGVLLHKPQMTLANA
jgi:hypothetical protein